MSDLENVATVDALAKLLVEFTGRPDVAIQSMARNLRDAGMLPEDGEALTPEHAANFVVAAVGASAASEVVQAVRVIGATPLWRRDDLLPGAGGLVSLDIKAAADASIPPGSGENWARISQSLVGALAYFIERTADRSGEVLPETINIRRSLVAPFATLAIPVPLGGGNYSGVWLHFGIDTEAMDAAYQISRLRMNVSATVPGLMLRMIGDLLAPGSTSILAATSALAPASVGLPHDAGAN
jgi:hypothetical protein